MDQGTRRRSLVAVALAACLLMTGCSADPTRADFARTFGGDSAIADLELSTAENTPLSGGVSAEVLARSDASDAEIAALVQRLSSFAQERAAGDVRIVLETTDIVMPVFRDAESSGRTLEAALAVRDDERVDSLELTASGTADRVTGASLLLAADAGAEAAFALAQNPSDALLRVSSGLQITLRSEDGSIRLRGPVGDWPGDIELAWSAVSAVVAATGLRGEPGRLEVRLASEDDVAAAALAVPIGQEETAVVFSSPLVGLGDGASGESVRDLLDALGSEQASAIRSLWTDDERVALVVGSTDEARRLAAAVSTWERGDVLSRATVTVGTGAEPTLDVTASIRALGTGVTAAVELLSDPAVLSVVGAERSVTVTVAAGTSDGDLQVLLERAGALAHDGARLCVTRAGGSGSCEPTSR